ncbi:MAG: sugar phosphate nucleotidyltransferase [Thermoanaerobaculaceae bacterium]
MASSTELVALVMAGGSGTRFWPLSRRRRPKQLLPFAEGRSLLSAAVERLLPLVPASRVTVVTGAGIAEAVRADLPLVPPHNVLAEPAGRDTAACIGWVAWRLQPSSPDAVMLVVPADHVIPDGIALRRALAAAAEVASRRDALVTLGLAPTGPEPGFGYLELGEGVEAVGELVAHPVRRFVEKPGRARAPRSCWPPVRGGGTRGCSRGGFAPSSPPSESTSPRSRRRSTASQPTPPRSARPRPWMRTIRASRAPPSTSG